MLGRWCSLRLYTTIYEQSLGSAYPKSIKSLPHPPPFVTLLIFLSCPMFVFVKIKYSLQMSNFLGYRYSSQWSLSSLQSHYRFGCTLLFATPPPATIQQSHTRESRILSRLPCTLTEHEESKCSCIQVIEHLQGQRPGRLASVQPDDFCDSPINASS